MKLKKIRKERGMTQRELAELTGVSWQTIQHLETGKFLTYNIRALAQISKTINVPISEVIDRNDCEGILTYERVKRGLEYIEFAKFLGTTTWTLHKAKNFGVSSLVPEIKEKIADKLDMTIEELIANDY